MAIVLASASPRRQQLLEQIGCSFSIMASDFVEDNTIDLPADELAVAQAKGKACAVAAKANAGDIVIGADTIVVLDGQVFGKPVDRDDACRMLTSLSGKEHLVITGLAVVRDNLIMTDCSITTVKFRTLTATEIERYIATGEPEDKAGAYAIQGVGALLVENICGCYTNIVGLPLVTLARLMSKVGVVLL
ncbi:Maf family protein [Anaerospora sp.]|uniref:Maf family protein n=1 Tax=Anaerospora sp. TaxID=1960278 RepID=UPI00289D447B|nr:Maf family protein [Anaerospora sp.]MDF2928237.1 Septum formation protein Maf [Anaerospora sp.]